MSRFKVRKQGAEHNVKSDGIELRDENGKKTWKKVVDGVAVGYNKGKKYTFSGKYKGILTFNIPQHKRA